MASDEKLEKLFFELASESRLRLLHEVQKENLKMQEIARRLDVTATEAFRQLERLSAASLVQRRPDSTFALTEYGRLVLQVSITFQFIADYKEYFSTHDLMRLPVQFVNRLGELSGAEFNADTIENLNRSTKAYVEAERYAWGIGEGTVPGGMASVMTQRVQQGIDVKMLILEERLPKDAMAVMPKNLELRGLADPPVLAVITEKYAAVCFRQLGGRVDYAGFLGNDPVFHDWVRDLFLHYWDNAQSPLT